MSTQTPPANAFTEEPLLMDKLAKGELDEITLEIAERLATYMDTNRRQFVQTLPQKAINALTNGLKKLPSDLKTTLKARIDNVMDTFQTLHHLPA